MHHLGNRSGEHLQQNKRFNAAPSRCTMPPPAFLAIAFALSRTCSHGSSSPSSSPSSSSGRCRRLPCSSFRTLANHGYSSGEWCGGGEMMVRWEAVGVGCIKEEGRGGGRGKWRGGSGVKKLASLILSLREGVRIIRAAALTCCDKGQSFLLAALRTHAGHRTKGHQSCTGKGEGESQVNE